MYNELEAQNVRLLQELRALSSPQTIRQLSMCPYTCHCSTPDAVEVSPPHYTAANPPLCHCSVGILCHVAALLQTHCNLHIVILTRINNRDI
jgi:hypothetical protein